MASDIAVWFTHVPACSPDAGIVEYLPPTYPTQPADQSELQSLLPCPEQHDDECRFCARKRRRVSCTAYPSQALPSASATRPSRPTVRGCRKLLLKLAHFACCMRSRRKYQLVTRYHYYKQKKPYSAISVHVEQLTAETYEEDDVAGIPDLIEVVRLQASGPAEVSRAIRKKLKYGSVHRQLRALTILDGILQNGGSRLQRAVLADGPLLERLRIAAIDPVSDPDVRSKCKDLFSQWVASSKDQPGLAGAKDLYNQLPKKQKAPAQRREQSKVLRETEEDTHREEPEEETRPRAESLSGPSAPRRSSSALSPVTLGASTAFGAKKVKKDKKTKGKAFNLEKEKPAILQAIAASSVASTNLNNALKLVNRENERVSEIPEVMKRFETCKTLRRQILRYIQQVESDEFLGGLIHANEELVTALIAFEVLDKSVDDDSDSELEEAQHLSRQAAASEKSATQSMASLSLNHHTNRSSPAPTQPPRPMKVAMPSPQRLAPPPRTNWKAKQVESDTESEEEDDPDDPFGDRNATRTPVGERKGYSWKEV